MTKTLNGLTSLRFFAAALIVAHHTAWLFPPSAFIERLGATDYGVTFFYVLSGFILFYRYNGHVSRSEFPEYLVHRFARIWPSHLVMLLLTVLLFFPPWGYPGAENLPLKFALNFTLLQAWSPWAGYFFAFNGVAWSLSVEVFFYAMMPLLLIGWHRSWHWKLAAALIVAATIAATADLLEWPNIPYGNPEMGPGTWASLILPVVRLPEFMTGMLAATLWSRAPNWRAASQATWTAFELAALGLTLWAFAGFSGLLPHTQQWLWTCQWFSRFAPAPIFGLLIMVVASGRGWLSNALGVRPLVFLGETSFALYLVHEVQMRTMAAYAPELFMAGPTWAGFILFWVIALMLSTALWALVERPCRKAIVNRYRAWAAARNQSAVATR